jgi:catechol 2,3-dioxygenase-like lactoylglutathione lyase family enzyme
MQFVDSFSGFSVQNQEAASAFYRDVLGLELQDEQMGLRFALPGGGTVFLYAKDNHQPASYTVLNLVTDNINTAVDELVKKGVTFERYDDLPGGQDERGILRGKAAGMGPDIAWFKDPSGNILSLIET